VGQIKAPKWAKSSCQTQQDRFQQNKDDMAIGEYAELLLGYALLAEGSEIPEPSKFNRLVVGLMLKTL
jgi:hypothetical protein